MNQAYIIDITNKALILVLILSLPPIVVATVVGVAVSLFQALTQVQEQTLSFAVKLIVTTVVIIATASWTGAEVINFTTHIFDTFPTLRR